MNKTILILVMSFLLFSCKEETKEFKKLDYSIITSDIDNFWIAYDMLEKSNDSIAIFQDLYINKASFEFKKFLELRNFTAKQYVDWIKYTPNFWKTIRPLTDDVKTKKAEINKIYLKFLELYPNAKVPDICFAISPIQSGGTTSKGLILIGTEIASVNPALVDISKINGFMKKVFENSSGNIALLIAHELVHTQQVFGDNNNNNESLLSQAIVEGSADFIATLILGELSMNKAIFEYGEKNQKELWAEFKSDVDANKGFEETDWFYDYNSVRPADLGYYLGYKISESYYKNSNNKKKAIKEIIEMSDANEFLKKSKYGW